MGKRVKALLFFILLITGCSSLLKAQVAMPSAMDFSCDNCPPELALVKLSKQSNINIAFSDKLFSACGPVTIHVKSQPFIAILDQVIQCAKVTYKVDGDQVVLYRKINRYTLSGYIKDAETGEILIGASIRLLPEKNVWTISNEFGFFSLKVDEGGYDLLVSYIGYHPTVQSVGVYDPTLLTIALKADNRLPEVVVSALPNATARERLIGSPKDLPLENLRFLPMPGGEADLLRLSALQPGVQTGVDGIGGLYIRGGNADQNLFLLDDVPVYNPGHALGLFSIYNPATVSSSKLWKGDFPARYGGRVSSVLDVRTRDGNFREYKATANVGLFASSVAVEGPLAKDKCSFLLGARTTYLEPWVRFFSKRGNLLTFSGDNANYRFFDGNLKLNYVFSNSDKVYFSYYGSGDNFKNRFSQEIATTQSTVTERYSLHSDWGNAIAAFRWNHLISKNLFTNTTIRYSKFTYRSRLGFNSTALFFTGKETVLSDYAQLYQTLIQDWSGKTDFTFFINPKLTMRWGMSYTAHDFKPGALSANFLQPGQSPGAIDSLTTILTNNELLEAVESELYVDAEKTLFKGLQLQGGIHGSVFQSKNINYRYLLPRLRLQYDFGKSWGIWAGYYRNSQYLHQIGSFNVNLPFELWVPSTRLVKPEQAWQTSAGIGWEKSGWAWQVEGYYKDLERVLTFSPTNEALYTGGALDASGWEDRIVTGTGYSKGIEFFLEKNKGNTTGSIAYTYSKTYRTFPSINSGKEFPFRFDRRHDLKIGLRQRITSWLDVSGLWAFATGNPITLASLKFEHQSLEGDIQRVVYVYKDVNGFRLPNYHRFDLALNVHYVAGRTQQTIQLGAYNTYNQANPFFLYVDGGSAVPGTAVQYTLLPLLPSLRYQVKF